MNPRTTAILAGVAIVLGAFVYFYELRGGEERARVEEAGKRLFQELEESEIASIELRTSDGQDARLERSDDGWQLVRPLAFPGDDVAADQLASALAQVASETVLEGAQSADVYGLGAGAEVVRFESADGQARELRIGDKAPVGPETYARAGEDGPIVTIQSFRANGFQKKLLDLRDRRVVAFDRSQVEAIGVSWPGGGVELERGEPGDANGPDASGWRLRGAVDAPADGERVEAVLSALSFLSATAFIDPPDSEASGDPYGLAAPQLEVRLRIAAGEESRVATVAVGREAADETSVPVRAAGASIYSVPPTSFDEVSRDVGAYRFRRLANFELAEAERFELILEADDGSSSLTLRGARDEDGGWKVEPRALKPDLAEAFLSEVSRLEATAVAAEAMGEAEQATLGLAPPRTRVRVWGEDMDGAAAPVLADFALGRIDPERGIAALRSDLETVFFVDSGVAQQIPAGLEAFDARFAAPVEVEDVDDAPQSTEADPD